MRSMSIRFVDLLALVALFASFVPSRGRRGSANPPIDPSQDLRPAPAAGPDGQGPDAGSAVLAALLPSWKSGQANGWIKLASQRSQYGSIPIVIDTSLAGATGFTREQLVAIGADVLSISNPAGGVVQYSLAEVAAVARYAREGHNVLGTFLVFRWSTAFNHGLAPSFGLREDLRYTPRSLPISNQFQVLLDTPLTHGLGAQGWMSSGNPFTEILRGGVTRNVAGLAGAVPVAQCDGYKAIVSLFCAPTYSAVFISNMPEYFGNASDQQLFYNAITLPQP